MSTHRPVTTKNTGEYDSIGDKKGKAHTRIILVKSNNYLPYGQSCKALNYTPPLKKTIHMFYENEHEMGILRKTAGRYTNCKHCIAIDLIDINA